MEMEKIGDGLLCTVIDHWESAHSVPLPLQCNVIELGAQLREKKAWLLFHRMYLLSFSREKNLRIAACLPACLPITHPVATQFKEFIWTPKKKFCSVHCSQKRKKRRRRRKGSVNYWRQSVKRRRKACQKHARTIKCVSVCTCTQTEVDWGEKERGKMVEIICQKIWDLRIKNVERNELQTGASSNSSSSSHFRLLIA